MKAATRSIRGGRITSSSTCRSLSNQSRTPGPSSEIIQRIAKYPKAREQMFFILSGAAGPRGGEGLGIEIDKHLRPDRSTIIVKQQARRGRIQNRVKTISAYREVDLHPDITKLLKDFIDTRTSGLLFQTRNGKPLTLTNILVRSMV